MRRPIFILAFVGGVLVAPLLCDAGVSLHACICESTECCVKEATCELDRCDVLYKKDDPIATSVLAPVLIAVEVSTASESPATLPVQPVFGNRPFPDSDLPLLI